MISLTNVVIILNVDNLVVELTEKIELTERTLTLFSNIKYRFRNSRLESPRARLMASSSEGRNQAEEWWRGKAGLKMFIEVIPGTERTG